MELGSHTMSHPDLRKVGDDDLASELEGSKAAIEKITGRPCRTLAYPYGLYDDRVIAATAAAGYDLAFAWLPGPWERLAAPRMPAPPRHGALRLAVKLAGIRRPR
jgi:peptidoglycan/xylan/chitin deacetylase (PgdA/CDA1 family)